MRINASVPFFGSFFVVVFALLSGPLAAAEILVEALLPGIAVMRIDGTRHTLRVGDSRDGVTLIAADARSALVEIGGRQQQLRVSQRISAQFSAPRKRIVSVPRNDQMQYRTTAQINGVQLQVIVDTGANIIAMNALQGRAVGIDPDEGVAVTVQTAGATVPARRVMLDSVDVGGIRVEGVVATVLEGENPRSVLLGMSYLQHVELVERNGVLTLEGRW